MRSKNNVIFTRILKHLMLSLLPKTANFHDEYKVIHNEEINESDA